MVFEIFILCLVLYLIIFLPILLIAIIENNGKSDKFGQKPTFRMSITDRRGIQGERRVNKFLHLLKKNDEYLLTNLLLPLKNGDKTEVDCVLITKKGVFCIETKNWVGYVYGDYYSDRWVQEYDDPKLNDKFPRNPIKQNQFHCNVIKRLLNYEIEIENIVIFLRAKIDITNSYTHVFKLISFAGYYRKLPETKNININKIYNFLLRFKATDEELMAYRNQRNRNSY